MYKKTFSNRGGAGFIVGDWRLGIRRPPAVARARTTTKGQKPKYQRPKYQRPKAKPKYQRPKAKAKSLQIPTDQTANMPKTRLPIPNTKSQSQNTKNQKPKPVNQPSKTINKQSQSQASNNKAKSQSQPFPNQSQISLLQISHQRPKPGFGHKAPKPAKTSTNQPFAISQKAKAWFQQQPKPGFQ